MKIAVMSDIHGNYIALQRCLAHALEQNVDAYIFLGDYLGEFPYPQRTLEILYELKQNASCIFIRGNEYYGSNVPLFRRNGYRQSGVMIP